MELPPIELQTTSGDRWRCNVLSIARLAVKDSEFGTRVYVGSGFYRTVVQSPEQIRSAAAAVIPDDYDGKVRILSKLEVHA